jgi:hypothetical protein
MAHNSECYDVFIVVVSILLLHCNKNFRSSSHILHTVLYGIIIPLSCLPFSVKESFNYYYEISNDKEYQYQYFLVLFNNKSGKYSFPVYRNIKNTRQDKKYSLKIFLPP